MKLIKKLLKKFSFFVNRIPFNNSVRKGRKNKIVCKALMLKCRIRIKGTNNAIFISKNAMLRKSKITIIGNDNVVNIGETVRIINGDIYLQNDKNLVEIGTGTNICGKTHLACIEGKRIQIGKDCLFSSEIVFRTGDSHSIYNFNNERINPSDDIIIGDKVWIGYRVLINKGVAIPNDCIVGTGAVVTKKFETPNAVIAGVPAKIVKEKIKWSV